MSVGFTWRKEEIDNRAGAMARDLMLVMRDVDRFKRWLDTQTDPDLVALGYSAPDITILRGAYDDVAHLADVFMGQAVQATPKNFSVYLRRMAGPSQLA